jgi:DNA replication protein DnaC
MTSNNLYPTLQNTAMLNNATIAQLRSLKLVGFADALQQQHEQADCLNLSFDERLALLVEREVYARSDRKRVRLLQQAQLKYPSATLEDASFEGIRGLDRPTLMGLALSTWIERGETVTFAGATGLGKTWLACALAQYACRQGHSALYLRVPRLAEELRILHGAGSLRRWLQQLAKIDVLVLDDWGIGNLDAPTRADLLEVIDDRVGQRATIIAHQLPIEHWHAWLGDPTVADAMLDRLLQSCRRFTLEGESRRTGRTARAAKASKNEHSGAP